MDELEVLARGFLALEKLLEHSHDPCRECRRAAIAEQRGATEAEVAAMLCAPLRRWRGEVSAARELALALVN